MMAVAKGLSVEGILGSKVSAGGRSVVIGLATDSGEHHLALSADLLTALALTVLKARTGLEERAAELEQSSKTHAFPCDKWEIRKSEDGGFLLFGFRHVSGAWIRIQAPRQIATPMRETLEIAEGGVQVHPVAGTRN
jgi:hypothetical protein